MGKDISGMVDFIISEGGLKEGRMIRITHLSEDEKNILKRNYSERNNIGYAEVLVVDALQPLERKYSVELTTLEVSLHA